MALLVCVRTHTVMRSAEIGGLQGSDFVAVWPVQRERGLADYMPVICVMTAEKSIRARVPGCFKGRMRTAEVELVY